MSANYFEYDRDIFENTKEAYEDAITNLDGLKLEMDEGIKNLQDNWKTDAGTVFFDSYDDDWKNILEHYVALLNYLKECIQKAMDEYNPLIDELESINP